MFDGKLSIIMPAYNEEDLIYNSIAETARTLEQLGGIYEIIVVDDGSVDDTSREAQRAAVNHPCVQVVTYSPNGGKGNALRVGFEHSNGDLVAFLDSDLDLHPHQLQKLYQVMLETGAEVVIGSKRHPDSSLDYPRLRKIISLAYFGLVRALFGLPISDTQTGIKLFQRQVLVDAFPRVATSGYAYDLELLVAATRFGYRIAEAPVELRFQRLAQGRIKVSTMLTMWWDTMRIFYQASFWKWLRPANSTKFWMVAFVAGLIVASFGAANALTFLPLPESVSKVGYYVALKFIPRPWRNLMLIVFGAIVVIVSLVQLNKSLMKAFARTDDGGLAGIWKKR